MFMALILPQVKAAHAQIFPLWMRRIKKEEVVKK